MLQLKTPQIDFDYETVNFVHIFSRELGWSCDRIAEAIDYSTDTVRSWSSGRRNPSLRARKALRDVWVQEKQRRNK